MSEIKYWMWLACLTNLRPRAKIEALEHFSGVEELFFATEEELNKVPGLRQTDVKYLCDKSMDHAMSALDVCRRKDIRIIAWGDSGYPRRLSHIYDPPAVLFVAGKLPAIDEECAIAVVGTRKCTPYGAKMSRRIGMDIARGGGLVVSGLAEGIDSAAAEGALFAGGSCIGVVGSPIDEVYPRSNIALHRDVCAHGAIISEFPPGTKYNRSHYPQRNRLLSGLSLGTVIIEAPERSGALITAEHAMDQGRDLFAVPGNADADSCAGSNALLRDCAKLTMCGWDILCEYEGLFPHKLHKPDERAKADFVAPRSEKTPLKTEKPAQSVKKDIDKEKDMEYIDLEDQLSSLTEKQLLIVSAIEGESYADTIIEKTKLTAAEVMGELTMLQIMGYVTPTGFDKYKLNIKTKRG